MTKSRRPLKTDIDSERRRYWPIAEPFVDGVADDADVARMVEHAITSALFIPETVTARVENGHVTLGGSVAETYQRDAAIRIIGSLPGVISVGGVIALEPEPNGTLAERR